MSRKVLMVCGVLALSVFFMAGCSKTAKRVSNKELRKEFKNAPEWVLTGHVDDAMSAVGSARIGKGGLQFARNDAMAQGRGELANQLSVKVESLVNRFAQQTGIGADQTLDSFSKQVSRVVTKETLAGSRQEDIWISPTSDVYVLMVVEESAVKSAVKREMLSSYQQDAARWQEFQAKNGFEELDREIDRAFGGR